MLRDTLRRACRPAILLALLCPATATVFAQGFGGTVADHLVRGDSLLAQQKASEAIVQFQEARTLCPTPAEIVSALEGEARGHIMLNETLPAAGLLEEAATRFPDDPRAANLLYQAAYASQAAGEYDKSIELYRKAVASNPTADILPNLKFQFAMALRLRGRPGEAIEALKDFEKDFPESPLASKAMYQLAVATHDLGTANKDRAMLEESAAVHKKIIEKFEGRPAAIEAHFEMGLVLAELGRKAEAADYFLKYVSLNPTSPEAPAALEKAGDLTFFRSPKLSAQYYALALVKAAANVRPSSPGWGLTRWLPAKRRLAETISSVWVLAIVGAAVLGVIALAGRFLVRRLRKTPITAGAWKI